MSNPQNLEPQIFTADTPHISPFNSEIIGLIPSINKFDNPIHTEEEALTFTKELVTQDSRLAAIVKIVDPNRFELVTSHSSHENGKFGLFYDSLGNLVARVNQETGEVSIPAVIPVDEIQPRENRDTDPRAVEYFGKLKQSEPSAIFVAGKTRKGDKFRVIEGNSRTAAIKKAGRQFINAIVFLRTKDMRPLRIPSPDHLVNRENNISAERFFTVIKQIKENSH